MNSNEFDRWPAKFTKTILDAHGEKGASWFTDLPNIIEEIEGNWSLKVGKPFENLSYHFVAPCVCDNGSEAVLKIGFPEKDSPVFNEAAMLKIYDGRGAVNFLRLDEKNLALLIEKLTPGRHLKTVFQNDKTQAVEIYTEALRKIIRKPPENHGFVRLDDWFRGFEKAENTEFPAQVIKKARGFYEESRLEQKFLLHGDFHHENILSAERSPFLAIDPKGIIGELGYEISVFLNNHVWWLASNGNIREKLDEAVKKIAEAFEIEPLNLRKWAFAQAVLSAWWTFEENGEHWKKDLALAQIWEV